MQSCLGIYIEKNLIKYAKVLKEKDNIKIESFGVKFYENINNTISQIISETNSTKVPISINISEEQYDYFQVFALLNKQAIKKSMDIEFDIRCKEKGLESNNMEKRYMFVLNQDNPDKMKAINVSVDKREIEKRKKLFEKYNLISLEPLPTSITNLLEIKPSKNELIVNLEENTYLTFIKDGQIDSIEKIEENVADILKEITAKENSQNKAYEILKNITITAQETEMMQDENEYLDVVIPVLFKILNKIKEKIAVFGYPIEKIYFSGTGVIINNIDMYFQDRLNDMPCEILKPKFLDSQSLKIGVKDFIEVNSAITMALNGLGIGTTNDLNFQNSFNFTATDIANRVTRAKNFKPSSKEKLDAFEKLSIRVITICILFIIMYSVTTNTLMKKMDEKINIADLRITETNDSISEMNQNKKSIDYMANQYKTIVSRLNNEPVTDDNATFRNSEIPNFLTKLTTTMPTEVKLVSIENTTGRHIVIQARALKYQQLGYFKVILDTNNILDNVTASTGVRYHDETEDKDYILVTIEGDLI